MRLSPAASLLALSMALLPIPALAALAVAANDGKQLQPGESQTPTQDTVSVLDMGA